MDFRLTVESSLSDETQEISVNDLLNLSTVDDAVTLYNSLCSSLIFWAQSQCEKWDDAIPLHISVDGEKVDIVAGPDWLWEVAQLAYFLDEEAYLTHVYVYMAKLDATGWKFSNFDDIEGWVEEHVDVSAGLAAYAQEYFTERGGETVPDLVAPHVDWESVGSDLLNDFTIYEFGGKSFYFNE